MEGENGEGGRFGVTAGTGCGGHSLIISHFESMGMPAKNTKLAQGKPITGTGQDRIGFTLTVSQGEDDMQLTKNMS